MKAVAPSMGSFAYYLHLQLPSWIINIRLLHCIRLLLKCSLKFDVSWPRHHEANVINRLTQGRAT